MEKIEFISIKKLFIRKKNQNKIREKDEILEGSYLKFKEDNKALF